MNILDLSQRYLLNATELRVLQYILKAVEQGEPKINIRTVAKESFVSTTVVVNLAKKLGYQGYSDMIYSSAAGQRKSTAPPQAST